MSNNKGVIFGAGNIGRGFLGWLLSQSGYEITFVDVTLETIHALNNEHRYPVHEVSTQGRKTSWVHDVSGVSAMDEHLVHTIADADLILTAVGKGALPHVAKPLAQALLYRYKKWHKAPLPVIVISCENMQENTRHLQQLVQSHIPEELHHALLHNVSWPNCAVDRIVPTSTSSDHPLEVTVEEYYQLAVDSTQLYAELPVQGIELTDDLNAVLQQKLFTLNMGHAIAAYFGHLHDGVQFIHEAMLIPKIHALVQGAFEEVSNLLPQRFPSITASSQQVYVEKVLERFKNPFLQDPVKRVGRDVQRKLGKEDRLVAPAQMLVEQGSVPSFLSSGIAAAFCFDAANDRQAQQLQEKMKTHPVDQIFSEISDIPIGSELSRMVHAQYLLRNL